jgi:hypothetical protein
MNQNDNVSALVKAMWLIPLAIIGFLIWYALFGPHQEQNTITQAERAVIKNPMTYADVHELFDAHEDDFAFLHSRWSRSEQPFWKACKTSPGGCLLMAVIQTKATPHQSGFFRTLDTSAFRESVDQGFIGVCKTKGGLEDAAYTFAHATVSGDPAQAFLARLSTISQLTHKAPQFLGAKDPLTVSFEGKIGHDLRQPELGGGFDATPPLALFDYPDSQVWVALSKAERGYQLVMLSSPKYSRCVKRHHFRLGWEK